MLSKITRHGQITLPKEVRDRLRVKEGDYMDVKMSEDGAGLVLRPRKIITIDPDQEWFWTRSWQRAEAEAERDIEEGRLISSREGERASEALVRGAKHRRSE